MPSGEKGTVHRDGTCIKCKHNLAYPFAKGKCKKGHAPTCPQKNKYKEQLKQRQQGGGGGGAKQPPQQQEATLKAAAVEGAKKKKGNTRLKTANARMAATAKRNEKKKKKEDEANKKIAVAAVEAGAVAKNTQDDEEVASVDDITGNVGIHPILSCNIPWDELNPTLKVHLLTLGFDR